MTTIGGLTARNTSDTIVTASLDPEHSDLHGIDGHVRKYSLDLCTKHIRLHGNTTDTPIVFCAVNAVGAAHP